MCDDCEWETALEQIETLLESGDYDWATDTLDGIRLWVEENEHITDRQRDALGNIEAARR